MMGRPQDNTDGNDATGRHSRFQFSLRSLLALLALTAWMIGWSGAVGIAAFVALGCLALVEAGCTPGARVLEVLNQALLGFFVCSLAYGAVGFGLMYGENPTGWFGTDQFLFAPLRAKVDRIDAPPIGRLAPEQRANLSPQRRADVEIIERRQNLHLGTLFCTVAAVLAHRVLIGRARTAGYILLWAAISGAIAPLAACWVGSQDGSPLGWLRAAGLEIVEFFIALSVGGWAALAGAWIFRNQQGPRERCRGLASAECHRALAAAGLLPLWLYVVIVGTVVVARGHVAERGILAAVAAGTAIAGLGGLAWRRRVNVPLTIAGGWAGLVAILLGVLLIFSPIPGAVVGTIAGALVVITAWLSEKRATKDPAGTIAIFGLASALGIFVMAFISNPAAPRPGAWVYSFQPVQLLGLAVLFAWATLGSGSVYWIIRRWLALSEDAPASQPAMETPSRE